MPARTQIVNGEVFYSPNSDRSIEIYGGDVLNPFGRPKCSSVTYQDLLHPLPWTMAFGWLAFVQMQPHIGVYPLSQLQALPPPVVSVASNTSIPQSWPDGWEWPPAKVYSYNTPPSTHDLWLKIGNRLYAIVMAMKKAYGVGMVLPVLPWGHHFHKTHPSEKSYRRAVSRSRDWIYIWLGAVSSLIAEAEIRRELDHRLPFWEDVVRPLAQPHLLDALRNTQADFSQHCSRVGCIIDLINPPPFQPPLSFFERFNIPVWYKPPPPKIPHGPDPLFTPPRRCDLGKNTWLVPPGPTRFQSNHQHPIPTASTSAPVVPPTTTTDNDVDPLIPLPSSYSAPAKAPLGMQPRAPPTNDLWEDHQAYHRSRHQQLLRQESPEGRQRRKSRARNPPLSKVLFNEWTKDEDGIWTKTRLGGKAARDRFHTFKEDQKAYDPFCNEWNLSYDWVPMIDLDSDSDSDYEGRPSGSFSLSSSAGKCLAGAPLDTAELFDYYKPMPPSNSDQEFQETLQLVDDELDAFGDEEGDIRFSFGETRDNFLVFKQDIPDILGLFYGFVQPLLDATPPSLDVTEVEKANFIRMVGHSTSLAMRESIPPSFFSTTEYLWAHSFFEALSNGRPPPAGTHDLRDDVILPMRQTVRFQCLKKEPWQEVIGRDTFSRTLYYFDFSAQSNGRRVCVTNAAVALMICRLPDIWDENRILDFLVRKAVPFKLFTAKPCLTKIPYYRPHKIDRLPERPVKHIFTKADYDAYVYNRTLILSQPHMQATIRRGGMVWRLALATLRESDALRGPTGSANTISATFADDLHEYIEDDISALELDLICGAYLCRDHPGEKPAVKSWWPLQRFFEKGECGENYGYWNRRREEWYMTRLRNIENPQEGDCPKQREGPGAENDFRKSKLKQPMTYSQWKTALRGANTIRRVLVNVSKDSAMYVDTHTQNSFF